MIKVRALRRGEYKGQMYEAGDIFEVSPRFFSDAHDPDKDLALQGWMEKVEDSDDALLKEQKEKEKVAAEQAKKDLEQQAELKADRHRQKTRDLAKEAQKRIDDEKKADEEAEKNQAERKKAIEQDKLPRSHKDPVTGKWVEPQRIDPVTGRPVLLPGHQLTGSVTDETGSL